MGVKEALHACVVVEEQGVGVCVPWNARYKRRCVAY